MLIGCLNHTDKEEGWIREFQSQNLLSKIDATVL